VPAADRPSTRVVDLDWRVGAIAATTVIVLTAAFGVVAGAPRTLTFLVIAGLLTLALNPVVGAVERRLHTRRGVAVAVVLVWFVVVITGAVLLLGPPAVSQARDLQKELPDVIARLGDIPVVGQQLQDNDVPDKVQKFIEDLPARLAGDSAPIEGVARSVVGGVLAGFATILLLIALLLDGERLVRTARHAVPVRYRDRTDRIGDLFYRVVGKYFAGSLLVAGIAGVVTLVVGLVLGIPLTPLLAVNVAMFDLVPQIGGAAGGIPFVALAFTKSPTTGVICAVFFVLYLQFENNILQPVVVGEAVNLSPPATMVGALVGVSIAGVPGALVAIPFLGAAKAVYLELRPPTSEAREAKAEAET
jgi:predicted PurR-regulated permease PerM